MSSPSAEVRNVAAAITVDPKPSPRNQRRHSNPLSPRGKNLVSPLKSPGAAFRNSRKSLGASPNAGDNTKTHMPIPSPPISGGSFRPMSPRPFLETHKVAEQTAQQERQRMKDMEKEELKMTADELRFILKQERRRMLDFAVDLAKLRSTAAQVQAESEMHEERAVNGLMRKLDTLKGEKSRLMVELDREEELVGNTLQKKLDKVRKEKANLQKTIDSEKAEQDQLEKKAAEINKGVEEAPKSETTTSANLNNAHLVSLTEDQEKEGEDDPNWYIENLPNPVLDTGCDT
ncbi:unnamed protein product [Cylindrotheca closterium]|uniref:Uncharacterized protein n=1 Tax=Cylindrotheca closterium TaxID=2856 RepID=A0AAD2CCJ4_9STRA|nr:unnamed protein product [Cylindrotheca closterium]